MCIGRKPVPRKLRVDRKLTNCEPGDRIVFIRPLKEPLPKVMKMGIFRATIIHVGQTVSTKTQACGKCLQTSHRTSECMNDWVCNRCKISRHKSGDCPMTTADTDDASQKEAEQSVEEIEADRQPQPQATSSLERAGNQPAASVASQ